MSPERALRRGREGDQARTPAMGPLIAQAIAAVVAAVAGAVALYLLLAWLLNVSWHPATPTSDQQKLLADLVKIALGLAAGIGAAVALTVGYRRARVEEAASHRDDQRLFSSRYQDAADLIGHDKAAVRLAGIYAMSRLADDWAEQRQQCIDVLCAYLRLPYNPDPASQSPEPGERGEREVRLTVIRLINAHLQLTATRRWHGHNFDFTGAFFDGGDFRGAEFSSGLVTFDGAEFSSGIVSFAGAKFAGAIVSFDGAKFAGGTVDLVRATFSGGTVDFADATFSGGTVDLARATFAGGAVTFGGATFAGGAVRFAGAEFSSGTVTFGGATFAGGTVTLDSARFAGGTVTLDGAKFAGGTVSFGGATFAGGAVTFAGAKFSSGIVTFADATFSAGTVTFGPDVHFDGAEFAGGAVTFGGARFAGGTVSFDGAKFAGGGTVDLSETLLGDRSGTPPQGLPEAPPPGLKLPTWLTPNSPADPPPH